MHNYFAEQSKLSKIFVLYGLGGSGKSEISRQFVACAQENKPKRYTFQIVMQMQVQVLGVLTGS